MNLKHRNYLIFGFGCLIFICIFFFVSSGKSHAGPEGLVGAWLFDEGKGNVAKDASENGHDGEIKIVMTSIGCYSFHPAPND